jgi:hypothetical protein
MPTGEELSRLPGHGPRVRAILGAPCRFLSEPFLETAGEEEVREALVQFYEECVQPPLHVETVARKAGFLRHALAHLLRAPDPLARKAERFLAADGPYHVAGLGLAFWSALFQALDPTQNPSWTPAVALGLRRTGLLTTSGLETPGSCYSVLLGTYARLLADWPRLSALHLDHFFSLVAVMQGRDLWSGAERLAGAAAGADLAALLRQERVRLPLRRRLKERGQALHAARQELEAGLAARDGPRIGAALAVADPGGAARAPLDWQRQGEALTLWVGRLWEAEDPHEILESFWRADPVPGAGLWLPAAVLHLRAPQRFQPWDDAARRGYAALAGGADAAGTPAERYRLFNEGMAQLRDRQRLHPLEAPAVLAAVGDVAAGDPVAKASPVFGGFCADTFRFLEELGRNNSRAWMSGQRQRYQFAVRV